MVEPSPELLRARARWRNRGQSRPAFAEHPGPGQESVWDYPRPPRIEPCARRVRVVDRGTLIAETHRALRVLETASPPTFYVPREDVRLAHLVAARGGAGSVCEWKGEAQAWCLASDGPDSAPLGWSYADPFPEFAELAGAIAFYPGRVECWLDDERVGPQAGGYYGGWISAGLVGPFKGAPGSDDW